MTSQSTGQQQQVTLVPLEPQMPDMYDNAKIEQIICSGLKPLYDGSAENLIPTLNQINVRRRNEVWVDATYVMQDDIKLDMVTHFSKVRERTVTTQAKLLWDVPDASLQSHTRGTVTYHNRLFGVFLLNSLTPDFITLLHSRIDSAYWSDGPLLLHTMCQHIHRNHLAFVESIKTKIRSSTLLEHNNDVPKYLRFLSTNLKLISSTGADDNAHNDLVPHLLQQLRTTTIPLFQQTVLNWQRNYFESTLTFTPQELVGKADQECQILTHAGQWVETIDPSVSALQASIREDKTQSGELLQTLAANLTQVTYRHKEYTKGQRVSTRPPSRQSNTSTPEWVFDKPTYPDQIRMFNNRYWHFCNKCGTNGRWVCTHTNETHHEPTTANAMQHDVSRRFSPPDSSESYSRRSRSPGKEYSADPRHRNRGHDYRSRSRSPTQNATSSQPSTPRRHVSWNYPAPSTPIAKLSVLDGINDFLQDAKQALYDDTGAYDT